jgi:hypothetical protein
VISLKRANGEIDGETGEFFNSTHLLCSFDAKITDDRKADGDESGNHTCHDKN